MTGNLIEGKARSGIMLEEGVPAGEDTPGGQGEKATA